VSLKERRKVRENQNKDEKCNGQTTRMSEQQGAEIIHDKRKEG